MTERYAKRAPRHIARTGGTAREIWHLMEKGSGDPEIASRQCSRAVRATETVRFERLLSC